jgi:hypothetical protein
VGDPRLAAAGIGFTLTERDERADLVAVARLLLAYGVLRQVAGDEQAYVNASGDALYDVNRRTLAAMLAGGRGPSTVDVTDLDPVAAYTVVGVLAAVAGAGLGPAGVDRGGSGSMRQGMVRPDGSTVHRDQPAGTAATTP